MPRPYVLLSVAQSAEAVAPHRSVHSVAQLHALVTGLKGD